MMPSLHRDDGLRETLPPIEYLPGGWMELRVAPALPRPILHHEIRSLHGMLTGLVGGHRQPDPSFALFPYEGEMAGIGWALYVPDQMTALRIASRGHYVSWQGRSVLLRCGALQRWQAPVVPDRRATLVVQTITPVIVRSSGRHGTPQHARSYTRACESNILSTLAAWLPRRCGIEHGLKIRMRFIANDTGPAKVRLSGQYGTMFGWAGTIVLEANPVAHWLLKAAEHVGLGGRVAYGFGRITVKELG